jgi:hypothetical protein
MNHTASPRSLWGALALFVLLSLNFSQNMLGVAPSHMWSGWQLVGQARVLGGIVADARSLDKQGAQLGEVYLPLSGGAQPDPQYLTGETYRILAEPVPDPRVDFYPYPTQFGLQGAFYSWVSRSFGLNTLQQLQWLPATAAAAAVVGMFLLYRRVFGLAFSLLFVACLAGSPFFVTMTRNLYWNPVLFFLPALAAGWMYLDRRPWAQTAGLLLVVLAMFLKAGSNYEYITSVTLLACAVFVAGPFFSGQPQPRPELGKAFLVGTACVVGFALALALHALARGDGSLVSGLRLIYEQDIARRTFGDAARFSGETAQSLNASVLDVLRIYLYEKYPDRRDMVMPGKVFLLLIAIALIGLAYKALTRHRLLWRDLALFVSFLAVPVSWFVFAKGHSFTQTHINFVLWYIGFMPALLFVAASGLAAPLSRVFGSARAGRGG